MTPDERNELKLRWRECEQQIHEIHAGRVVRDRSPAEIEAQLLEEQDIIEFELGADELLHGAETDADE